MATVENKTMTLMVQGTTSDAGKSILVAGFCRLLARQSIAVAPFKPQNMALNSAVTIDGGEIGRAQAVQAQACRLEPHTDFNPVLLKPSSDTKAQVIIQGKAVTHMGAKGFHDYKRVAMAAVLDSYHRLCEQYAVILVEGAGSPAEINLRDNDIANMGFAEQVDCPVILIADIDRGGVFAHLVGTLSLLSPSEQQRISGFVINRFRGDLALLKPGLDWLEQKTGKPVWGVLPYLDDFYLDAEDAIGTLNVGTHASRLKIVVPVFSRISNHTDFDALQLHPDISLQFVPLSRPLPPADLVILPGSKNVRQDLSLLRAAGWDIMLLRHLRYGGKLMGICGGYQMLGQLIEDPEGIESSPGSSPGLGLLNITTRLCPEKMLKRVSGELSLNPQEAAVTVVGYEIHCGTSIVEGNPRHLIRFDDGRCDGVVSSDGAVIGTYVHGLFDMPDVTERVLAWAGLVSDKQISVNLNTIREEQLERLADTLEQHLSKDFLCQFTATVS